MLCGCLWVCVGECEESVLVCFVGVWVSVRKVCLYAVCVCVCTEYIVAPGVI